ncbi:YacL family protein [Oceanobacter kriegii]|uniref:YacL family protein n=1 Tax=Oceanobacter kriegii TaxID=64972 RepID=UPI0003F4CC39|nr:YacL family protein [Oceanobacter kriegii]
MDYEFWFEGHKPVARLDDEQLLLGRWLTDEIGDDLKHLRALITTVELLLDGGLRDYRWQGKETILQLTQHEAEVLAHEVMHDEDINLEEEQLSLQESDQQAGCGLDDFLDLLLAWKDFIAS